MTNSTRSTTLGILSNVVIWGVMIILVITDRAIGHSNTQFIYLLAMHLGRSIISTIRRWVPVCVPLGTVPHIVTRFTTAVKFAGDCNLLRISTSTTPAAPTTASQNWWRRTRLGGSGHGIIHSSGDSLTHHGLKRYRISQEGSVISSGNSQFSSRYIRPRARGPVISINKFLVLVSTRSHSFLKVQTIHLRN